MSDEKDIQYGGVDIPEKVFEDETFINMKIYKKLRTEAEELHKKTLNQELEISTLRGALELIQGDDVNTLESAKLIAGATLITGI